MKVTFFLMRFPVLSETFVMNQIIYFINRGMDVRIISVFPGESNAKNESYYKHQLSQKLTVLVNNNSKSMFTILIKRLIRIGASIHKSNVLKSLNYIKYGPVSKKLLLGEIIATNPSDFKSDFFLAHFGYAGSLANKLRDLGILKGKIATIFHGADLSHHLQRSEYKNDYVRLFTDGELMLPISNVWKQKLISLGCDSSKIKIVRMGIDPQNFEFRKFTNRSDKIKILTVARFVEKKGIKTALEACLLLRKSDINFHYNIIGGGELEKELDFFVKDNSLQKYVSILGFKTQAEIKEYLDSSDIFLLPSQTATNGDQEGIPVALMEAMAVGIPVISTYHSGIPELIEHGVSGWLVKEKDAKGIADIITKLISDAYDVRKIIEAARIKVQFDFNQKIAYEKLISILEKFSE